MLQEPRYRRIVIADGPAVLGYERYREQEERTTFGIVQEIVSLGAGHLRARAEHGRDVQPGVLRRDVGRRAPPCRRPRTPRKASAEVEAAIAYILAGLRAMAESGAPLPRAGRARRPRRLSGTDDEDDEDPDEG